MNIAFVLPTKNESATISTLISEIQSLSKRHGWQSSIIVADDSTDNTKALALELGAEVIDGGGIGLGHAMLKGLSLARSKNPDWVLSLDSDGQVDPQEIPDFLNASASCEADVVLSSRFLNSNHLEYSYPLVNWLGNRILVGILRLATWYPFTDSHGGIRLMRPEATDNLMLIGRHTYVQETLIQMHRQNFKIIEVPSRWRERRHGDSRVLASIFRYIRRTLPALLFHLRAHWLLLTLTFVCLAYIKLTLATVCLALFLLLWSLKFSALYIGDARHG